MSIFPQFVNHSENYIAQFSLLVITYSSLVLIIHFLYAYLAKKARNWFTSEKGGKIINRAGGSVFVFLGIGLAATSK